MRVLLVWGILLLAFLTGQRPASADEMIPIDRRNFEGLSGPERNQVLAMELFFRVNPEWTMSDWVAMLELFDRESDWMESAANPNSSARGIPQAMTSLYPETQSEEWLSDPEAQIRWGMGYIRGRYGNPRKALEHHDLKGWY